jgi:hypothetical protein
MRPYRACVPTKSKIRMAGPSFRSELERQLLEIQDAFGVFVDDAERETHRALEEKQDAEDRLREMEGRLRIVEREKQDTEDQLRCLKKQPAVRIIRFFTSLNPFRSTRKGIR